MRPRPSPPPTMAPQDACTILTEWRPVQDRAAITRSFRFADFAEAFGFMSRIAILAEKADHHPEWFNVYDRLDVVLTTHESGGVTDRDIELARAMDEAFARRG